MIALSKLFTGLFTGNNGIVMLIILILLALIIVPNSSIILERLGFETRAKLKEDKAKLESNLKTAIEVNASNQKQEEIRYETVVIVREEANKAEVTIKQRNNRIENKVREHKRELIAIETNPPEAPASSPKIPSIDVIEAKSLANIKHIWDVYNTLNSPEGS